MIVGTLRFLSFSRAILRGINVRLVYYIYKNLTVDLRLQLGFLGGAPSPGRPAQAQPDVRRRPRGRRLSPLGGGGRVLLRHRHRGRGGPGSGPGGVEAGAGAAEATRERGLCSIRRWPGEGYGIFFKKDP